MTANSLQPTDFQLLSREVDELVESSIRDGYQPCVDRLLDAVPAYFPVLTQTCNPIRAHIDSWRRDDLAFIIKEYSGFSNAAIHMFLEARIRNHWPALKQEIIRNMDEEMGELTRGIPHLELMRYGYRVELGLETDGFPLSGITSAFINRMNSLFCDRDNTYLAGVLLAFEGTAAEEFRIVDRILHRYKEMLGDELRPQSLTWHYIAGHVLPQGSEGQTDPEVDHGRGMIEAIGISLTGADLKPMAQGFLAVCLELSIWWERLASETWQKRIRENLIQVRREAPELYSNFLDAFGQTVQ